MLRTAARHGRSTGTGDGWPGGVLPKLALTPRIVPHGLVDEVVHGAFELLGHLLKGLPEVVPALELTETLSVEIVGHEGSRTRRALGRERHMGARYARGGIITPPARFWILPSESIQVVSALPRQPPTIAW